MFLRRRLAEWLAGIGFSASRNRMTMRYDTPLYKKPDGSFSKRNQLTGIDRPIELFRCCVSKWALKRGV